MSFSFLSVQCIFWLFFVGTKKKMTNTNEGLDELLMGVFVIFSGLRRLCHFVVLRVRRPYNFARIEHGLKLIGVRFWFFSDCATSVLQRGAILKCGT
jgi:hypothetical protein